MNKFAKACYDRWQCRKSVKIGGGFIITSLVFFANPLRSLSGGIEVTGISELPYTGVNMWFLILGILLVIGGSLAIALPKYRKRAIQ